MADYIKGAIFLLNQARSGLQKDEHIYLLMTQDGTLMDYVVCKEAWIVTIKAKEVAEKYHEAIYAITLTDPIRLPAQGFLAWGWAEPVEDQSEVSTD
jgi:hypothetical protein